MDRKVNATGCIVMVFIRNRPWRSDECFENCYGNASTARLNSAVRDPSDMGIVPVAFLSTRDPLALYL